MPEYSELPFDPTVISLSVERHAKRSPGIHLSTILRDMRVTAGIQRGKGQKPLTAGEQHIVFQQGFLWENAVAEYIASPENQQLEIDNFISCFGLEQLREDARESGILRPGECQMDGIYLTPDGINMRLWHGEEWKATAIRKKNFDIRTSRSEWLWQGAAYLRIFGMTRMIYRVWHTGDFPQCVSQIVVDWTKDEIESNWSRILEHYEYMKANGRA